MEVNASKILDMLRELNPYEDFDENTQIIEEGIIDSLTLVILIEEIENEFQITIPENELKPENFESVVKMVKFLNSL